MCMG